MRSALKHALENNLITNISIDNLVPKGCSIPRLYGLPKIHKNGTPLRPILSMVGSATHKLSKFLVDVLKPVEDFYCHHDIKDSFHLIDQLKTLHCNDNTALGSLDIVSLYTNVPVKDAINACIENGSVIVDIERSLLIKLLCVTNIQFMFNQKYYRQIDGVAMGSPLGPILANIFVGHIEKQVINNDIDGILFYGRYVDDTIVVADSKQAISALALRLDSINPSIKFTVEYENENGVLPFLDILITKTIDKFTFGWHHKDTWCGSMLHFNSFVPFSWKRGLLKGYKYRLLRICSSENLTPAIEELTEVFTRNGYPHRFIQENFIDFIPARKTKTPQVPKKPVSISLPFLGDETSAIWTSRIKKYVESTYPASRVLFYWKTTNAINTITKDKIDDIHIPKVVYQFTCGCSSSYIGRTERQLGDRINQHIPDWLLKGGTSRPHSKKSPDSAVSRHLINCKNRPENPRKCFKILHKGKTYVINQILEALEIKQKPIVMCSKRTPLYFENSVAMRGLLTFKSLFLFLFFV